MIVINDARLLRVKGFPLLDKYILTDIYMLIISFFIEFSTARWAFLKIGT